MAGKKDNLKSLFANTRTRIIILFTFIVLFLAVLFGYLKFSRSSSTLDLSSSVSHAPGGIQSIPGSANPTVQYAKLQQQQNLEQAQQAKIQGGSAIPTIIRTQTIGSGVGVIGSQSGIGFSALARENEQGTQKSLWLQQLKNANCSKSAIDKIMSQGAQLNDLKEICSCVILKDYGYSLNDLESICSCNELKSAGFNVRQLKDTGYSSEQLRVCGFDACELRNAGYSAQQMKDGGFSDGELKGAGFSPQDILRTSGLPDDVNVTDVLKASCSVDELNKMRQKGVSASAIRRITGCNVQQLKAARFTAQELKNAGFSAANLLKEGFTPEQLKEVEYKARDLLNAGLKPDELAVLGYSATQLKGAESELLPGVTFADIHNAGCDPAALQREREAGVSAVFIKQYAGCQAHALHAAGFSPTQLEALGFTPQQISAASVPISDDAIRAAGCDPNNLKQLFEKGVSATRIKQLNGCNAQNLKNARFSVFDLAKSGFTPQQLSAIGFTPAQLVDAGFTSDELIAAGFTPAQLLVAGVTPAQLRAAGFTLDQLARAGLTPQQLSAAGVGFQRLDKMSLNPQNVIAAGRSANCSADLLAKAKASGLSSAAIVQTLGCSAGSLKNAKYTIRQLKHAGFTAAELKNIGFNAQNLKSAGFSAKNLKDAGFSAAELKASGFSPKDLKNVGFSAADLKAAGYTAQQLKTANFDVAALKLAGFTAEDLKNIGFSPAELKAAGYTATDLKKAGVSIVDLKKEGYSPQDLKNAGYTAADLKAAGYSAKEVSDAGFSAADAVAAGYTSNQLAGAGFTTPGSAVAGLGQPNILGFGSNTVGIPSIAGTGSNSVGAQAAANTQQLQSVLNKQNDQMAEQKYQQKIQQRTNQMLAAANQQLQHWKTVSTQTYTGGTEVKDAKHNEGSGGAANAGKNATNLGSDSGADSSQNIIIKTGDIVFAVMDTAVNSDEPGPILATIVSGQLKGTKIIGSFNLPSNANSMVITFNTMSMPSAVKTFSISAYAIDPNTARTALSSRTDHHYLMRYGSLFASSFLEGFGNAFQSADTTVTVGGTGSGNDITIQNGIGRSALENAVIGLATVGKSWSQVAQQSFNTPVTVEVFAGTGIGVLFTQDVTI